ncbi:MAG: hypothetical protein IH605_19855 [Burkholderiales bacterium]|nr:hypothetical protein [Burkholderiales bacterium]
MKLREIFIGKPVHWAPWVIIAALMLWMNSTHFHVLHFNFFALALIGMAAGTVALFLLSSRPGELVTREPFAESQDVAGTGSED